jgi:hypothetical protein
MYGETEEELFKNAKEHGIQVHGYTEETWNKEIFRTKNISRICRFERRPRQKRS